MTRHASDIMVIGQYQPSECKSKPRKYLLIFYLKGHDGERGVDEVKILDRANFIDLAEYIHLTGNEIISDIGVDRVNIKTSYVSIKA